MIRQIVASLAVVTFLTVGGVTGAMAQQGNPAAKNPCAVKPVQNPCAAKGQPAEAKSEKDALDAIHAEGKFKSASELAKDIAAQPTF